MVNTQPGKSKGFPTYNEMIKTFGNPFKNNFMEHEQIHLDPVQREAIKQYKLSKDRFKKDIAVLVAAQKDHKKHRSGEYSQQEQSRAQQAHAITRRDLHSYYIAYALFRRTYGGYTKHTEQLIDESKVSMKYIDVIVKSYVPKTIYTG